MRPIERIETITNLIKEVWLQNPDMRLGQLLENCGIGWHSEDMNENIVALCDFGGLPIEQHLLWGTRGKNGKGGLTYKKLHELETSHLKAILKDSETTVSTHLGTYFKQPLSKEYKEAITSILNSRE